MASFKNVQKKRSKKTSHFSYTTEGMTSLTSPQPPRDSRDLRDDPRHDARSVLSVRPDQDPVLRDVPGEDNGRDLLSSVSRQSSQSSEIHIPPDALSKLQEIIEAQKAYLKYQEIRGILSSRQENESSRAAASRQSRKAKKDEEPVSESSSKSVSINLNSDSDKENSKSSRQPSANIRKVAKVSQDVEKSKKRKSDSPISELVGPEDVVKEKRSVMTSHVAVQSTSAQTESIALGAKADEGVTCDWAYWVKPDTGQVRPARVTIRSSRGRGQTSASQGGRAASASGTRSQSREARPWRVGMKTASAPVVAAEENIVDKPLPEKPWRKNMRTEPKPAEPEKPKPKPEERAWRNNMKKDQAKPQPQPVAVKKRHYDRKEVRDFIKMKKIKGKEEMEEKEREENIRKEMVKRRLTELDKLQKQISEADAQEFKKLSQSERNLSEEGQRVLRDKLIELTEQMKIRWRERQDAEPKEREYVAEESSSGHVTPKVIITSRKSGSSQEQSKKSESKKSQHIHLEVEETGALSLSEVSDATEIKSLSENPRNHSNSNRTNDNSRNVSLRTNDSSRTWKDRLLNIPDDDTKYRSLERAENFSLSQVPTPLTDEVPERDLSDAKVSKSEKLRKIVSEVFDRHKSDLELIRNTVEDVDVPDTVISGPVEDFVPRYPSILSRPEPDFPDLTSPQITGLEAVPRPVPSALPSSGHSEDTGASDQPPQWMEVTKEDTDHELVTPPGGLAPGNLSSTVYKGLPHPSQPSLLTSSSVLGPEPPVAVSSPEPGPVTTNNAMAAVLRKYHLPAPNNTSIPSNMAISEGILSPSDISEVSSYAGVVNPQTYSKDKPDVLEGSFYHGSNLKSQKTDMEELTDSESTLKDIDDLIIQNSPRLQEDLEKIKKALERRNKKKKGKQRDNSPRVQPNSQVPSGSSVPDALHLRFLTELHQLETVNNTQRLLDELDTIKKSAFDNHRGLEEVQHEMTKQRKMMEEQSRADKAQSAQRELQELYSSKLQMLLESQNEVTKVTSDVAKHLADLANGRNNDGVQEGAFSVVQELQTMIETLQEKQKKMSIQTTQTSSHSISSREKSKTSTPSKSRTSLVTTRTSHRKEESGKDETDGVIRSEIPSELRTLSSKPPSSILELIEQNQATGSSIQKTISEALASISESERKTKSSNITEEVEEELSTDYSSHFDDESTLKEKSFQAVLPSVSHRRKSMKTAKRNLRKELSSETSDASEKERIEHDLSSNSLFSDTHSFSRFTLEMVNQYMEEENVRDQHKKALLKAKEKALIEKAKIKMDELNQFSEELRVKGQDDKMPNLNKKKKAILSKLKERRAEIEKMRGNLKVAEKERSFLLQEQKSLLLDKQSSRKTDRKSSPGQESEGENISRIEVLQGLKRLDKSRKHYTSKEKKLLERSSPVTTRAEKNNTTNTTFSSALDDTENDVSRASDVDIKIGKSGSNVTISEDDSIQTQISRSRASTVRTSVSRTRHSSNDSELEEVREAQDTISTVSDHSDVELRIAALSEKLQTRMRTAAKLKKEQKRERKEMLRNQEVTLKKQIEKYEQLISEGFSEIASEKSDLSNESFSRPKIKSPISGKSEKKGSSPRTPIITPEMPSLSSMSFVEEDIKLETDQPETPTGSTSTILASPKKNMSPSPPSLNVDSKAYDKISEAIEDIHSSAVSSKSSSPVSKLKLIAEGKGPEIMSPEKSKPSVSEHFLQKSEYSSQFESSKSPSKEEKKAVDIEPQQLPLKRVSDKLVDSITDSLWTDILRETNAQIKPKSQVSPQKREKAKPKSNEFTLAFDVTSSSEESTAPIKQTDSDLDLDVNKEAAGNEFMDDDFGLSNIRQEAEILRLQQLRVEEEILALQRESEELGQPVPDKPPPPYQPPDEEESVPIASVPPPRPEKPPQVKVVVPSRKEDVFDIIAAFVESIVEAKRNSLELSQLCFDPTNVVRPEDYSEGEQESCIRYHSMLFSVTLEKVQEIYKWESTEQNPPWMQQLPLAQKRFLIPKSLNELVEKVQTEVGSDLKLTKKFGKENLLVRWAGKKRDRVDEILVRELQEEEAVWVNYGEDEVEVKEQMADIILEELISDTARAFAEIQQRVKK